MLLLTTDYSYIVFPPAATVFYDIKVVKKYTGFKRKCPERKKNSEISIRYLLVFEVDALLIKYLYKCVLMGAEHGGLGSVRGVLG